MEENNKLKKKISDLEKDIKAHLAKIKELKNKLEDKEHDNTLIEETSKK